MKTIINILIVNIFLYLLVAFCKWDINWISHAGDWKQDSRIFFLVVHLLFNVLGMCIIQIIKLYR